ncbi:hypothetical protein BCR43DRAFT_560935 [Syncephalastrum racemosum]|uniref:Cyclin N-terminal domain-containing protein n=1 Tax=Syncephalastrum racemosum TaxID=13706 RepID=A0A1X2HNI2_SYNRA|nr:hypothetical protein BCR43DRAFT_560935 [Syncephalastrum racemosum]
MAALAEDPQHRRLMDFIDRPTAVPFLAHIAHQTSLVIPCQSASPADQQQQQQPSIPPLPTFVNFLVRRSSTNPGTLLGVLVLLDRLRERLAPIARGMPCTCQRIFLATLIVTSKALHDTAPRNRHWTRYAHYFTVAEINLMEKQLLALLDFQLSITLDDLYGALARFDNSVIRRPYQQPPRFPQQHQQQQQQQSYPLDGGVSMPPPVANHVGRPNVLLPSLRDAHYSSSSSVASTNSSFSVLFSASDDNNSSTSISSNSSASDSLSSEAAIRSYYVDKTLPAPTLGAEEPNLQQRHPGYWQDPLGPPPLPMAVHHSSRRRRAANHHQPLAPLPQPSSSSPGRRHRSSAATGHLSRPP